MDRFLSHFRHKLDSKGRVSIPASFRAVLQAQGSGEIYAHPHLDQPTYEAGGKGLLTEVEARLAQFPPYSQERELMALAILGSGELMKLDGDGRITLSDALIHYIGIQKEVVFTGLGERFQLWEPGAFKAQTARARESVLAFRRQARKITE